MVYIIDRIHQLFSILKSELFFIKLLKEYFWDICLKTKKRNKIRV
jgi:hypothetical protein